MEPSVIVEGNPVHDLVLGLAPRPEAHAVEPFDLQRTEQRFGDRIVPAIALAAHRAFHFEAPHELAVVIAGVLTSAIRVEDQAGRRMPPEPGHPQGIHSQRPRHALAHCKADHLPVEQIDHHGKIEPAFIGPDVGNVACPDLVRRIHGEVARQHAARQSR